MISTIRQKSKNPGGAPMRRCIFGGTMIEYEHMFFPRCRCISSTIFFRDACVTKFFEIVVCPRVFSVNIFFQTIKNTISCTFFQTPPSKSCPNFDSDFEKQTQETAWSTYFLESPRLSSWYFKNWCQRWITKQLFHVSFITKYWRVLEVFGEPKNRYFFALLTFLRISASVFHN